MLTQERRFNKLFDVDRIRHVDGPNGPLEKINRYLPFMYLPDGQPVWIAPSVRLMRVCDKHIPAPEIFFKLGWTDAGDLLLSGKSFSLAGWPKNDLSHRVVISRVRPDTVPPILHGHIFQ